MCEAYEGEKKINQEENVENEKKKQETVCEIVKLKTNQEQLDKDTNINL